MKRVMSILVAGGLVFSTAAPVFAEDHENSRGTLPCGELGPSISVEESDGMKSVENRLEPSGAEEVNCDLNEQNFIGYR